jgi:hypothetical protein
MSKAFNGIPSNLYTGNNTNKAPIFIAETDQSMISNEQRNQPKQNNSKGGGTGSGDS